MTGNWCRDCGKEFEHLDERHFCPLCFRRKFNREARAVAEAATKARHIDLSEDAPEVRAMRRRRERA